jgi:hypothetical protein
MPQPKGNFLMELTDLHGLSWLSFFYTNANAFCLRLHQTGKQRANTNLQTFHGSAFSIQMPMLFV